MAKVYTGWAYVSGSGTAGGSDTQIQFNDSGNLNGTGSLTWDGSQVFTTNLSASHHISASAFTGDGSNLTGLTASAVAVADGPEMSVQFRYDSPIGREISGSADLMWITGSTDFLQVTGAVKVAGFISASTSVSASEFYVAGNTIYFGTGNTYKIGRNGTNLDINAGDSIVLNAGSGHVSASTNLSASAFYVKDSAATATADPNYADIVVAKNGTAGVSVLSSDGTSAALLLGSPTDNVASEHLYAPGANYSQIGHARAGGYVKLTSGNSAEALRLDANQNVTASNDLTASGNISGSSFYGGTFYGSAAGLTNTTIPSNASDNHVLIASSGFITTNPANAVLKSDRFDIGSSGFTSAMTGSLFHVTGAGALGNDHLFKVSGRDAGQIFEVTGSGGAVVTGFLSASQNISASAFYGTTFSSSLAFVSGNHGALEYVKDWGDGDMSTTESLGGKITLGGYGNPYLQTRNIALQGMGSLYNNFNIGHSGQIQLSSSMADGDMDLEGIKFTNNPGQGYVAFEVNRVGFIHNTASLNTDPDVGALEYVWEIASAHAAEDEESAWVKLDLSSSTKNFQVGGRDNIQLQAKAGLLVEGGTTIGNAHSDSLIVNASASFNNMGNIYSTASNVVWQLHSGSSATGSGPTQNGPLLFFSSGAAGTKDYLKFHTEGPSPGVVIPNKAYMENVSASANISASAFYTAGDIFLGSDQKVYFESDLGSYIESDATDRIRFVVGGNQMLLLDEDEDRVNIGFGNKLAVGLGNNTTPDAVLHVSGSGGSTPALQVTTDDDEGSLYVTSNTGRVGVGTTSPSYLLHVSGTTSTARATVASDAAVIDMVPGSGPAVKFGTPADTDQYMSFGTFSGRNQIWINSLSYDFQISASAAGVGYYFDQSEKTVGVGTQAPRAAFHVSSSSDEALFKIDSLRGSDSVLFVTGAQGVGINTDDPKLALDVHYSGNLNPVNLASGQGGGEVAYFGTSSAEMSVGALYYLNRDGGWMSANSAFTGSGHDQLLGVALGVKPARGVLLRGYFNVSTYFSGSFVKGAPMYIQSSSVARADVEGGYISGAAPSAGNSYVRVVGYGTDTANVIYFNPSSTYVEISGE